LTIDKPTKGLGLAFGGLGLKFKEKILKETEDPIKAKFYDFLMTLRERESMLSESLRDILKPKYCKNLYWLTHIL